MVKHKQNILFIGIVALIALIIFCAIFGIVNLMPKDVSIAYSDTFDIIFPKTSYIQSTTPTLIGANDNYLIVYDKSSNAIYSRSNSSSITTVYGVSFNNVDEMFAIGNSAFISADDKYFTIDLSNQTSTPQEVSLNSPQDISYLATDGTYLYAHSSSGYISLYDDTYQIALGIDNQKNSILTGKNIIAASGSTLYVFEYYWGESIIREYNLISAKQINSNVISQFIQEAYVGEVIYAVEANPNNSDSISRNIICLDKQSGQTLFVSDVCPDNFFAYNSTVFAIEGRNIVIYTLNQDKTALELNSTISMTGNDLKHFDNPSDVATFNGNIIVADSNNNRVATLNGANMSVITLDFSPISITASDTSIYTANDQKVVSITNENIQTIFEMQGIQDIVYLDMLYILTTDGVYTMIGDTHLKLIDVKGARRIACAKDGDIIYLLKDDCVMRMTSLGKLLPNAIEGNLANYNDLSIDYIGQIFLSNTNSIIKYYQGNVKAEYPLQSSSLTVNVKSAYLNDTSLCFVTKESFLGATNVSAQTKASFVSTTPTIDRTVSFSFVKAKDNGALYYDVDAREESIAFASEQVMIALDSIQVVNNKNLTYALQGNKVITIDKSQFDTVNLDSLAGNYITTASTTLYSLPHLNTNTVTIDKDVTLKALYSCEQFENGAWIIVKYEGDAYFAPITALNKVNDSVNPPIDPPVDEEEKVFGKAKADRVGGLVNVYGSKYASASVLMQIVDGTEVEVLEDVGDFYKVLINGKIGYMLKEDVVIGGLTTVQIIAIVLCIIVLIAGSAIFVAIHLTKKHEEEKKKQNVAKVE